MAKAKPSSDQIKLYVVVGLSIVAALMAYTKFVRKSARAAPATRPAAAVAAPRFEIPPLPRWIDQRLSVAASTAKIYVPPRRDIFSYTEKPTPGSSGAEGRNSRQTGQPQLSAIMMGTRGRLAVISDRIVAIGDKIGPYTVMAIDQRRVVLVSGDERLILTPAE